MQGSGGCAPQKLTQYIKVTFSNLLNSYDNTMAYYMCSLYACCKKLFRIMALYKIIHVQVAKISY